MSHIKQTLKFLIKFNLDNKLLVLNNQPFMFKKHLPTRLCAYMMYSTFMLIIRLRQKSIQDFNHHAICINCIYTKVTKRAGNQGS